MKATHLLVCAAALSLLACGDDKETRSPYSSGVQGQGPVSNLNDDELAKLCRSYDAHVNVNIGFDAVATVVCLPQALLFGGDQAGCRRLMAECKANQPPPVTATVRVTDERACVQNLRQCNQTVASLEGCINVNLTAVYNLIDGLTCGDYGSNRARMADLVNTCVDTGCKQFAEPSPQDPIY